MPGYEATGAHALTTSKPIANPPIVELVLGLQFDDCPALTPMRVGAMAGKLFPGFSRWEQRPALEPIQEVYPAIPQGSAPMFRIVQQERPQRCWLMTPEGERLLQVQEDRFILNWRKTSAGTHYPGYEAMVGELLGHWQRVLDHLPEGEAQPQPELVEFSYINLFQGGDKPKLGDFLHIKTDLNDLEGWEDEHQSWMKQAAVFGPEGAFLGRVYLEADNRWDDQGKPCVRLLSTGRGLAKGNPRAMFDRFHTQLNEAFDALVRPEALGREV